MISLALINGRVDRHFHKNKYELHPFILQDGRVALVYYLKDKKYAINYMLKAIKTGKESTINFIYIDIYNSVSELTEVTDGLAVRWSGEKYFTRLYTTDRDGPSYAAYYFDLYRFKITDAKEVFPNIYVNMPYLKDCLMNLKR